MRILMLTNAMEAGGAETHILSLCESLIRLGHTVTVCSDGGRMVSALCTIGARHVTLPLNAHDPLSLLRARRGLKCLLRADAWDVVHTHARLPARLALPICVRRGICAVSSVHAKFSCGRLARKHSLWGSATVAVSEDLRDHLCDRFGVDPRDVTVIRNGINLSRFSPPSAKAPRCHVVFMSRLDADCAETALLLCRIAPRLHRLFPDLTLTVAGGGNARTRVARVAESITRQYGVPIRMTGHVSDPAPLLQRCDVFVGVSRAAMEAMACGTSVVLGGNEGFFGLLREEDLPTVAQSNFCARECEPVSEERLFTALFHALSESEAARKARGDAMRRYAEAHLDAAQCAKQTESFYRQALQNTPRRGDDVLLCGYYGFGNGGDEELLRASLTRIRTSFGACGVAVLSQARYRSGPAFGVRHVPRRSLTATYRALCRARIVIFGGGTLLQSLTSRRSLWYYALLLRIAERRGAACELWGNGLGPFFHNADERRVAACLRACRVIGLRDTFSVQLAKRLLGEDDPRIFLEKDAASDTPPSDNARLYALCRRFGLTQGDPYILVVPKKSGRGLAQLLEHELSAAVRTGARLLTVSLYPHEDTASCLRLCSRFGGLHLGYLAPSDFVALASLCRRVYGMRLHALIFAASARVPFTAVGTDPKLTAFAKAANASLLPKP